MKISFTLDSGKFLSAKDSRYTVHYFIVIWLFSSILQLVQLSKSHRDQIFKLQVLTGNSVSNTKFHLVYGENGYHWLQISYNPIPRDLSSLNPVESAVLVS